MTRPHTFVGPCESCGASDAECDDADYLRNASCCEQCHHLPARTGWVSLSRSAPAVSTIVAADHVDDQERP